MLSFPHLYWDFPTLRRLSVRVLSTLTCCLLLASGCFANSATQAGSASAATCSSVAIPAGIETRRNTNVSVPLTIDSTDGRDIISFDYTVTYNPAVLTYVGVSQTGNIANGMTITVNPNTPGVLIVSGFTAFPLVGSGVLMEINFNVVGAIGTSSPVNFSAFMLNEGTPCSTTTNGSVNVIGGNISGSVRYVNGTSTPPVPSVTLSGTGSPNVSGTTNLSGTYALSGFGAGAYTVTPSKTGDVNGISSFDSALIAQHVVGLVTLGPTQLLAADVSSNNFVTSFDAGLIAQYLVLIPNAGTTGSWKFLPGSRSYASVEGTVTGDDYGAILMGEVSGNWTAPTNFVESPVSSVVSAPQAAVAVTAGTVTTSSGSTILFPITVTETGGNGIISFQFDMNYNPAYGTPVTNPCITLGSVSVNMTVICNVPTPGTLKVAAFGVTPISGSGNLIRIQMVAGSGQGSSPVTITNFQFNEDPALLAGVTNGAINILIPTSAGVGVSGFVIDSGGQAVRKATVFIANSEGVVSSTRTDAFGRFAFDGLAAGCVYVLSARARGVRFDSQIIQLNDSVGGLVLAGRRF